MIFSWLHGDFCLSAIFPDSAQRRLIRFLPTFRRLFPAPADDFSGFDADFHWLSANSSCVIDVFFRFVGDFLFFRLVADFFWLSAYFFYLSGSFPGLAKTFPGSTLAFFSYPETFIGSAPTHILSSTTFSGSWATFIVSAPTFTGSAPTRLVSSTTFTGSVANFSVSARTFFWLGAYLFQLGDDFFCSLRNVPREMGSGSTWLDIYWLVGNFFHSSPATFSGSTPTYSSSTTTVSAVNFPGSALTFSCSCSLTTFPGSTLTSARVRICSALRILSLTQRRLFLYRRRLLAARLLLVLVSQSVDFLWLSAYLFQLGDGNFSSSNNVA